MSIKKSFLFELENEVRSTKRILDVLTDEHLDWKPHEKSMSLKTLAVHTVEMHNWLAEVLEKDVFDFQVDYKPLEISSVEGIQNLLKEGLERNKRALENFSDDRWGENWSLKSGDHLIRQMPKKEAIRFIVNNHVYHHRGQLTVYLRLLDLPVPGLYGPSADDKY